MASNVTRSAVIAGAEVPGGYAQRTSDFTNATTTLADVTGLSFTVVVAAPIILEFWAPGGSNSAANGGLAVAILEDATNLGLSTSLINVAAAAVGQPSLKIRRSPTLGSHTYKVQAATVLSGTATVNANTGGAGQNVAMFLRATYS